MANATARERDTLGRAAVGSRLFLVADDLTGALDSAARFASADAPVAVCWRPPEGTIPGGIALDAATREVGPDDARRRTQAILRAARPAPDALLYAKLDSLLRGNAAGEIAAWLDAVAPRRCVIAPAFPYQKRITRGGRQFFLDADAWVPTAADLVADLRDLGVAVAIRRPGQPVPDGVSFWDAETDADLATIATAVEGLDGTTLWCGSGGLAAAVAGGPASPAEVRLAGPILGLFGTDHPVMREQIGRCADLVRDVADGVAAAPEIAATLAERGRLLVRPDLPLGLDRAEAARRIEHLFADLVARLDPPGTLIVAGGETLHGLCRVLGTDRLDLDGEIVPGVPTSRMRGGRFDGVRVVSKSGAFGDPDLLRRLLAVAPLPEPERSCS